MTEPLIDAHAHFLHARCGRSDWADVNAARFRAGEAIGITCHVASVLGSYGFSSPTYFPSPDDVTIGMPVQGFVQHFDNGVSLPQFRPGSAR